MLTISLDIHILDKILVYFTERYENKTQQSMQFFSKFRIYLPFYKPVIYLAVHLHETSVQRLK